MKIIKIKVTSLAENTYIYFDDIKNNGIIIDPGGEFKKIKEIISSININIVAILLTHGHIDHIGAVNNFKEYKNIKVYCHKDEKNIISDPYLNLSSFLKKKHTKVYADHFFEDGDIFELENIKIKVIHTPGHTKGSVCYYDYINKNIFTGDTLFKDSIGRSDFPTGDYLSIKKSIKDKLFILENNVNVFCGHGENTTIKEEKYNNQFFN